MVWCHHNIPLYGSSIIDLNISIQLPLRSGLSLHLPPVLNNTSTNIFLHGFYLLISLGLIPIDRVTGLTGCGHCRQLPQHAPPLPASRQSTGSSSATPSWLVSAGQWVSFTLVTLTRPRVSKWQSRPNPTSGKDLGSIFMREAEVSVCLSVSLSQLFPQGGPSHRMKPVLLRAAQHRDRKDLGPPEPAFLRPSHYVG